MPIYVDLIPTTPSQSTAQDLNVVRAGLPEIDGCTIFTGLKAFVISSGVAAVLEHTIRNKEGVPIDLTGGFPDANSTSESEDGSLSRTVVARLKEAVCTDTSPATNPLWQMPVTVVDAIGGVVRTLVPRAAADVPGIYTLNFAIRSPAGETLFVDDSLLAVERGLFSRDMRSVLGSGGPPSLNEIRLSLLERSAIDNELLQRLEFSDAQVLDAITYPVMYYNEQPPPIGMFDTRTFPWQIAWLEAIVGYLLLEAAANYRRNAFKYTAGGISRDDKNKEMEYSRAGTEMLKSFRDFVINKKVEINLTGFVGHIGSPFGGNWRR